MPIYQYQCPECNREWENLLSVADRGTERCRDCHALATQVFAAPAVHTWTPGYFYHLDTKPIYIESKEQLRDECKKRGKIAHCLS